MSTPMTLPVYMLAMRPQTNSGFSMKSIGPGCRPQMMRPPSITAAVGDPGMPSVIIGSIAATPAAWAAVSGRHHPFQRALAELLGVAREAACAKRVAHERRRRRAARLEAHPEADERAAMNVRQ